MRKVFRTYSDDYPRVVSGGSADMPFLLHKLNPQRISGQVRIAQTNVPYTMDWDLSSGRMKKPHNRSCRVSTSADAVWLHQASCGSDRH